MDGKTRLYETATNEEYATKSYVSKDGSIEISEKRHLGTIWYDVRRNGEHFATYSSTTLRTICEMYGLVIVKKHAKYEARKDLVLVDYMAVKAR